MAESGVKEEFTIKINGVEIITPCERLTAHDILELAKEKDAMPGKIEDYFLQGDKGKYKQNDLVDLKEDNLFITVPDTSTPVASIQKNV